MGKSNVTVHTIYTDCGSAFMHVDDADYGTINLWTSCYHQPVYIVRYENQINILQFDNKSCETEYFENHPDQLDRIVAVFGDWTDD